MKHQCSYCGKLIEDKDLVVTNGFYQNIFYHNNCMIDRAKAIKKHAEYLRKNPFKSMVFWVQVIIAFPIILLLIQILYIVLIELWSYGV